MRAWAAGHGVPQSGTPCNSQAATDCAPPLLYGGGVDGIGVTTGPEKVYLVFYGSQWGAQSTDGNGIVSLGGDPANVAPYLQHLFKGLGTGGELWSGVMTQYCDGVSTGASSCPSGNTQHVGYPTGGALAGVWVDESAASPGTATAAQLGQEAVAAAGHFGNTTAGSNRNAQYVILSPTGTHPDNFPTSGFCAWHDWNGDGYVGVSSPYGDIAFTNSPYVADVGRSCGASFVNAGTAGALDGVSIVEGHEYAETITDQNPIGGWTDSSLSRWENGDECAWIAPGTAGGGGSANLTLPTGTFAMQSTWSNDSNACAFSHPIITNPPVVTGVTGPPLLQKSPFTVTFGTPVKGVTTADLTVVEVGPVAISGAVSCLNAANAAVSCAAGPVSTARFTSTTALIAGEYYFVNVNPSSPGVVDYTTNVPVAVTQGYVRAQTVFTAFQYPVKYTWAKVVNAAALGGSYVREFYPAATESFTATGASLGVVTWNGPDGGTATVTITTPGQPTITQGIDTYAAVAGDVVNTFGGLPAGKHTVKVTVDGAHNGTSTGNWVRIDATVVGGVTNNTPALTAMWPNYPAAYAYTSTKGATVSFKFRGTGVVWNAFVGPNDGKAKVTIDGVVVNAAQDLYAAGYSYQPFTFGGLVDTFHTVVITTLGTKNAASSDTIVTAKGFTAQ